MYGYIFETTNKKTGETYLGKRYAVSFDKNFLGDADDLAVAIEKYGRPSFEVRMIMPYETQAQIDAAFDEMQKDKKPKSKKKVEEEVEAPVEEVEKPIRRKSTKTKQEEK